MRDLETNLEQNPSLNDEEIKAAKWLEEMIPGSNLILLIIKRLSPEEKSALYSTAKKRKPEYSGHFNKLQERWLKEHVVYVDERLIEERRDNSPGVINSLLTDEVLEGTGENVRCCIYYALMFPERIDPPYSSQFSTLLGKIDIARRAE